MSESDEQLLDRLQAAVRGETAPAHLAERVIDSVEYRQRLQAPFEPERRAWRLALVGCAALAVAAAVGFFFRAPPPNARIAPEQTARAASAVGSAPRVNLPFAAPCRGRAVASGAFPLLDDFEDGDDALPPLDQRSGFWRWARESDAPGTAPALIPVPRVGGGARQGLALHVKGGRLFDWGATVEVNFQPGCYDATAYAGIKLQARGPGRVFVALREIGVIPLAEGGSCEHDCHNPHVAKLELSADWRSYEVRWSELRPRGLNTAPLDPSRLHSVAFLIHPEDTPYDVWLDDVRFLTKQ